MDAPRLHVKKSNVAGLSDIVDNGDTVTFQIDLRITGAPVVADQLTNITITDTLPAHYEFVSFAALPATGSCNESNDVVVCTFGNQVSPWNDSLQITVKVQQAQANQVLDNRVTATAIRAAGGELVSDTSMAYAYMPDGYRELSLRKEVPDMLGPCIKPPGSTQQSADDCSLFDLNSIITYTLHYTNDSNLPISNTHLIDVFPFNGDTAEPTTTFIGTPAPAILPGIVGDGRTPPSNFAGTLALAAPPTVGSMAFTPAAVNFYYTAAPPATISRDPADAMHTFGAGQMWCTTADFGTGGNCPAALSTATALYAELGDVPVGSTNTITVTFQTNGNSTNNIYTNNFGARTLPNSTVALALPMRSNDVSAMPTGPEVNLGNQIWKDLNNNGLIDGGEQGIGSVEVELYQDTNGDGVYGPGDTLVMTTTTTATGHYTFTGLTPTQGINETYMVVLPSTNFVGGGALEGHHNSDGNGATAPDPDDDVDDDDNGTPSGTLGTPTGIVASQPIELTLGGEPSTDLEPNDSNYTVDFGFYQALSLGNQVWFDTNNNGQIDATEQGIDNVVVELYIDSDGNGVYTPGIDSYVDAVTTVAGGHYTFTELLDESYVVVIPSTNFSGAGALVDYHSSDPTEADPDADVDHNDNGLVSGTLGSGGYVSSGAIDLDFNQEPTTDGDADAFTNWTVDFGFYTMSLGNQVWEDLDNNGLLDPGESGISNVTVELLDAGGAVVDTTTTDPSGFYTFTGLISGTYSVRITTPSTDYVSSTPDAGDPDNDIDDSDDNGVGSGTGQITSDPITLIPGDSSDGSVSDDGDGSTENPLVDFGIWQPLNLGNRVWLDDGASADDGVLDGDENGIDGVTVELYDSNGALVGTTTTQNGGYYTFTGLISDTYEVLIPASNFGSGAPLEKLFSSSGNSSDDQDETVNENGIDDADPATNGISSAPVILSYNSEPTNDGDGDNGNLTIDFGFVYYDLALIKERSAGQGYALNFSTTPPTASFDILVENQGPADVNNVTVVESIPAGMRLVSVNGTPITPVTGTHTIAIPNIAAGSVATLPVIMEIYDLSYGAYTNIAEMLPTSTLPPMPTRLTILWTPARALTPTAMMITTLTMT